MEASLVERWAADGSLPTFASLAGRARAFTLDGRIDQLPDVAWPEIGTGRLGASIGWFSVSGSALQRRIAAAARQA